jgi:small GTP-binding protein
MSDLPGLPRADRPRLKLILVGGAGVGKTCLIASFLKKPFDPAAQNTVSPAYMFRDVARRDGLIVSLQIWDTAGQERYRSVSQLFYRESDVALVCFESGNEDSLDAVSEWISQVRKESPECEFLVVGTKADLLPPGASEPALAAARQVLAEVQPRGFFLTSAATRDGVDAVFCAAGELYVRKQQLAPHVRENPDIAVQAEARPGCC